MKYIISCTVATLMLSACANSSQTAVSNELDIAMANPASVYCKQQGGRLEPRKDKAGNEYAMCHLPDGRVIEEWAFFRANNK